MSVYCDIDGLWYQGPMPELPRQLSNAAIDVLSAVVHDWGAAQPHVSSVTP